MLALAIRLQEMFLEKHAERHDEAGGMTRPNSKPEKFSLSQSYEEILRLGMAIMWDEYPLDVSLTIRNTKLQWHLADPQRSYLE